MKQFFKSTAVVSFCTFISRISGLIRDIFFAKYLGNSTYSDIFFTAMKIPNFFRRLFAEGAFNLSFTPMFASGIRSHGKRRMMFFARNIFSILFYFLLFFTLIVEIFMPLLLFVLAPGMMSNPTKSAILTTLTRITFPYIIFISLVSFVSGILNTFNKFAATSIAPVFMNIIMVVFLLAYKNSSEYQISLGLSYSIFTAGFIQLIWIMIFSTKEKLYIYPVFPKISAYTKIFFRKFSHALLGSGIIQINSMVDSIIATIIPNAVSFLYYGDRISQFPLSIIGTAIGISALPTLSQAMADKKNNNEAQELQENAIFLALFLGIPCTFGLFPLSQLLVEVLLQRGKFLASDTIAVSNILKIYSIAIPFFILSKVLQTIFFAKKDTKTPTINSLYSLIINLVLNIILGFTIGVNGIAIATTIATIVSVGLLFYKIIKTKIFELTSELQTKILKILHVSICMSLIIVGLKSILIGVAPLYKLIIISCAAGLSFFGLSHLFRVLDIRELVKNIYRKL